MPAERPAAVQGRRSPRMPAWIDGDALTDAAPLLVALAPFAAVIGVQSAADGRTAGSLAGTLLLYAGSAQVSTLSLLHQGAGLASILAAVALVNARFVAYSAALAPRFAGQPAWFRWLGPHFVIEQTFALATARDDLDDGPRFRRYWLTSSIAIAVVWVLAMTAGVLVGPAVPSSPATAFMPAAIFIAFTVPALTERPGVAAAGVACLVAAVAPLPSGARVLAGTACGALVGLLAERVTRR